MSVSSFQELKVWQKGMDLVEAVYEVVKQLPAEERFELGSQMRRAAVSIPSNIAEGQERYSDNEFATFLSVARGSSAELQTQLMICVRVGYLKNSDVDGILDLLREISRMLSGLINKLKAQA